MTIAEAQKVQYPWRLCEAEVESPHFYRHRFSWHGGAAQRTIRPRAG